MIEYNDKPAAFLELSAIIRLTDLFLWKDEKSSPELELLFDQK